MGRYYDVLQEHTTLDSPDSITVDAYALIVVWRYANPVTFSRAKQASFSKNASDSTALRADPLIIVDDIRSVQVQSSKNGHVGQFTANLTPGMNYLTEMFPGDWVGIWMIYGKEKLLDLMDRIQSKKTDNSCNQFNDGLKFIGHLTSVRKKIIQAPDGVRVATYSINGASFTEFDATIYFEPYLASTSVGTATDWLQKTGIKINNVINQGGTGTKQGGGTDINTLIPELLSAFYKGSIPQNLGINQPPGMPDVNAGLSDPNSFIIPQAVATVLGVTSGTKDGGQIGWCDICSTLIGIQQYQLDATSTGSQQISTPEAIFIPDILQPLLGTFLPSPPQFDGQKTVWSILEQFRNQAVNEMYTTLRVDKDGTVRPVFTLRQLPFSSGAISTQHVPAKIVPANIVQSESTVKTTSNINDTAHQNAANAINSTDLPTPHQLSLTRLIELPRWRIHPILLRSIEFGRSDAVRFNFVHVYPETGLNDQNRTGYIVRDPPIRDDLDIIRHGLRPYMQSVNCSPTDAINRRAGDWMYILSDIVMGQHLTLSGTMECYGIQSPISIGDNIEFDNHVFHIETLNHSFSNTADGRKSFSTSLMLTYGMKAEQLENSVDLALYTGTNLDDLTQYEPKISNDYQYSPTQPSTPSNPPLPNKGE